MLHRMRLNPEPFAMMRSGMKTIELRLYDEKRALIKAGDEIEFRSTTAPAEKITARVISLHRFKSFRELYASLPLTKCGYTEENVASASYLDMDAYYSKEEQALFGVVGIEIKIK